MFCFQAVNKSFLFNKANGKQPKLDDSQNR